MAAHSIMFIYLCMYLTIYICPLYYVRGWLTHPIVSISLLIYPCSYLSRAISYSLPCRLLQCIHWCFTFCAPMPSCNEPAGEGHRPMQTWISPMFSGSVCAASQRVVRFFIDAYFHMLVHTSQQRVEESGWSRTTWVWRKSAAECTNGSNEGPRSHDNMKE